MQHSPPPIPANRYHRRAAAALPALFLIALAALTGCDPVLPPSAQPKPFDGRTVVLSCPEAAFADAIAPIAKAWAARTGATVSISRAPMTKGDAADAAIIPSGALGEWAEEGLLVPVPAKVRTGEQYQWQGLLPAYGERLCAWGGQIMAVPITGDGYLVVVRENRFEEPAARAEYQKRHNRPLAAPATWQEFADIAVLFADLDKRPSLPPLPDTPDGLFDLFGRVAASCDRRALDEVGLATRVARDPEALAFQYSVVSGKPRVQSPGFQLAAQWLARVRPACAPPPAPGTPSGLVTRFADPNGPVLALVSLERLADLPREGGAVPKRFALAPVPGSRTFHDAGSPRPVTGEQVNYVPYFSGGRLGVVRTRCAHPDAAFDLLAELGGPARGGELVATPGIGAGPMRGSHLERERLLLWLGYGFDNDRSKLLQDVLRQYVGQSVKNPTLGPRGPDREAVVAAVAGPLRQIAAGAVAPEDGLKRAEEAWMRIDATLPAEKLLRWRLRGAGLN